MPHSSWPDLASGVETLEISPTVAIDARARAMAAAGETVFRLGFGQSPFPVPSSVVDGLRQHAVAKDYLPVAGLPRLRDAVARHAGTMSGTRVGGEDVVVGPGSKTLLFLLQLVLDAELLVPSPSWVSYAPQARLLNRPVRWIDTRLENDWILTPEALSAACVPASPKTRLLVLNSPGNPTGTSYTRADLEALADVVRRERLLVLSDEIYGLLHHGVNDEATPVSMVSVCPEQTIVSSGLSKWCGAGGWRVGTFVFPPGLAGLRHALTVAASEIHTTTAAPIQHAAVVAYEGNAEIDRYLAQSRWLLAALGRWCHTRLVATGIACAAPTGGFYLFPRFPASLNERGLETSTALCERLLADTGVALLPGVAFGRPAKELSARLAYVDFGGAEALELLARQDDVPPAAETEAFLRRACPRVMTGIERVVRWVVEPKADG